MSGGWSGCREMMCVDWREGCGEWNEKFGMVEDGWWEINGWEDGWKIEWV